MGIFYKRPLRYYPGLEHEKQETTKIALLLCGVNLLCSGSVLLAILQTEASDYGLGTFSLTAVLTALITGGYVKKIRHSKLIELMPLELVGVVAFLSAGLSYLVNKGFLAILY